MQSTNDPVLTRFGATVFLFFSVALTTYACAERDCTTEDVPLVQVVLVDENGTRLEAVEGREGGPVVEYRSGDSDTWRDCDVVDGWHCSGGGLEPETVSIRATFGELSGMTSNIRMEYGRCHP
ncbi:MAG: hypothetical protein ACJAYU_004490, partial [Bradymonadia bacterium]